MRGCRPTLLPASGGLGVRFFVALTSPAATKRGDDSAQDQSMRRTKMPKAREISQARERAGRSALIGVVAAAAMANPLPALAAGSIDLSKWSPDYVKSIAGTIDVDTAGECSKVVPLDYQGRLTYWYTGPTDAEPEITK